MSTPFPSITAAPVGVGGTVTDMCDTLTTFDGAELDTVGELRRYGIAVPAGVDSGDCLCALELPEVLAGHTSAWKRSPWFDGYVEVGPDDRTWFDGFDDNIEEDGVIVLRRSDGRREMTLEQIEAAR